jgi:hypothetical protein
LAAVKGVGVGQEVGRGRVEVAGVVRVREVRGDPGSR